MSRVRKTWYRFDLVHLFILFTVWDFFLDWMNWITSGTFTKVKIIDCKTWALQLSPHQIETYKYWNFYHVMWTWQWMGEECALPTLMFLSNILVSTPQNWPCIKVKLALGARAFTWIDQDNLLWQLKKYNEYHGHKSWPHCCNQKALYF